MIKLLISLQLLVCLTFSISAQTINFNGTKTDGIRLENFLKKKMDSLNMPGLSIAVIKNGKLIFHDALGLADIQSGKKIGPQSIFEAASLSKTVFAYFVMKQVDKGLLDLDRPLYQYLEYEDLARDSRYKVITARMILSHTSGLPNWRTADFADSSLKIPKGQLYLKFKPGTEFSYSGEGYYYLSQVIAHLNKCSLQQLDALFQQEVAKPLGLPSFWFSYNGIIGKNKVLGYRNRKPISRWPGSLASQDSSKFGAAGGLHTEAVTYAKFLIALMEGKGLKASSAAEFFKPQVLLKSGEDHDGDTAWGLGIAIMDGPTGTTYEHRGNNGNFQSYFWIDPKTKSGYVYFTNSDLAGAIHEELNAYLLTI